MVIIQIIRLNGNPIDRTFDELSNDRWGKACDMTMACRRQAVCKLKEQGVSGLFVSVKLSIRLSLDELSGGVMSYALQMSCAAHYALIHCRATSNGHLLCKQRTPEAQHSPLQTLPGCRKRNVLPSGGSLNAKAVALMPTSERNQSSARRRTSRPITMTTAL